MDDRKSAHKRLNAKEVIFPKEKMRICFFSNRRWTNQTLGGDQDRRTSTLIRQRPIRGESNIDFLGESEGSLPPPHDSFPDAGESTNDFWSLSGNFIFRHHVELRVKLYSPREESFRNTLTSPELFKRIWMSGKRNASMIIGISMGQETCLILGQVSLDLFFWKKKPPDGYMWSGVRLTRKQLSFMARSFMARTLGQNGKARQAEGETKVVT